MRKSLSKQNIERYISSVSTSHRVLNYVRRKWGEIPIIAKPHTQAYQNQVKNYEKQLPKLHEENQIALSQLKKNGIFITHLSSFNPELNTQLIEQVNSVLHVLEERPTSFDRHSILMPDEIIRKHPLLYTWGLQKPLLNVVENYIELPVAYHGAYFRRDFRNGLEVKSRQWHIDMEDYRILKVIIYLREVKETNGPFQYLSIEDTNMVRQKLNYTYGYLAHKQVEKSVPIENWKSCLGRAGTIVIVDTARLLHRGKIPTNKDRYTLFYDYTSRTPRNSFYCKSSLSIDTLIKLSEEVIPEKIAYMLWRN